MRGVLRSVLFSAISLIAITKFFDGISFGLEPSRDLFYVALGFGIIQLLIKPIFKLMSLPDSGLWFFILNIVICFVSFYLLDKSLSGFSISEGVLKGFSFFGFVVQSRAITEFWAYGLSSLTFATVSGFLSYLCGGKK